MTAFEALQKYYSSPGNMGAPRATMREEGAANPAHVVDGELEPSKRPIMASVEKDSEEEAIKTFRQQSTVRDLKRGIDRKNADAARMQRIQNMEKARPKKEGDYFAGTKMEGRGDGPGSDKSYAQAYNEMDEELGHEGDVHHKMGSRWRPGMGDKPWGSDKNAWLNRRAAEIRRRGKRQKRQKEQDDVFKSLEKASVSPHLARLLAAAAGWALSGDIAGKVDPHLAQEWDRATSMHDKKRLQEDMMRQMHRMHRKPQAKLLVIHRKSDDGNFLEESPAFDDLNMFYKDHAPIPPRYGLMWDAVKHRWTRPEKIGRTVWEVQGKKRYRGTGTGAHERGRKAGGSGGYGSGSSEAGRRFRSTGDIGRLHPHESKHPGQHTLHRFGKVRKLPKRR